MTFFYDLNKKLDEIRETPELTHKQLNERDMSRAAKGYEKYGKQGMEALAKAGREGKDLDPVRNKYDKYDDKSVDEGMEQLVQRIGGIARKAKKLTGNTLDKLTGGSDADQIRDLQRKMGLPQTGLKPGDEPNPKIVKEKMNPAKQKSFAALAPPTDKITFADKIAGAKKEVDEMLGDVAAEAMKSALSGGQKKLDKNNNGKLDANDFAMLRKGAGKKSMGETQGATTYTVAYKDPKKPGKSYSTQVKATSAAEAKAAFQDWDTTNRFTYLGSRPDVDEVLETDDDNPFTSWKKPRAEKPRVGSIERGHKHDIEHTATGRKVTRRVDDQGNSVGADDDSDAEPQKRGRGRPKSTGGPRQERTTANARKSDRTAHGQSGFAKSKKTNEGDDEGGDVKQAMALLKKAGYKVSKAADGAEQVDEKATSKKQQKFMGMVHAAQKGEKPASKEVGKVAKTMKKGDAEDFASTKHKGLPEKAPKKKEKEVEESSTTAGSVATSSSNSSAKGMSFGKGIYDSFNRDLETMISESMSINMSNSTEGGKSLTITASDEDAVKLATLLKSAGLGGGGDEGYGGSGYKSACGCGTPDCSCGDSEVDEAYGDTQPTENQPNWPTNQEGAQDNFEYSGGLNKPKSTGQSTVPVLASQDDRQESYAAEEEDALHRMMEMAGIEVTDEMLEEGWKEKLGAAGLAGAMALGSLGAGAAQSAPQQSTSAPTSATQQQKQDIWMPAYRQAFAYYLSTKNPDFKKELDSAVEAYRNASIGSNLAPKSAEQQKQLDFKHKDRLEQLLKSYGAMDTMRAIKEQEQVMALEESVTESFEQMLSRMRDIAGIKEGKKPDFLDMDKDGDKKEPFKKAVDDKKEKKVDESILAATANLWSEYKGQYGV